MQNPRPTRPQFDHTWAFECGVCGGWIPSYHYYEKEVAQGELDGWEDLCTCERGVEIRREMDAVFHPNHVEALRLFREAADRLALPHGP